MLRRVILWFVVLPVSLPAIFLGYQHFRGRSMLAAEIAQLEAAGEILDIRRLAPPPVPAASNGLKALLAAQLKLASFANLPAPTSMETAGPGIAIPPTRQSTWGEGTGKTNDWARAEIALLKHGDAFEDLYAALAFPARLAESDWPKGFAMLLPALAPRKSVVQALGFSALCAAQRGDATNAIADLEAMRVVEADLAEDPLLIGQLVRCACAAIANGRTWGVLHAREWSEPELRALQESLRSTNLVAGTVRSLRGERALVLQEFRKKSTAQLVEMLESSENALNNLFGPAPTPLQMPENLDQAAELATSALKSLGDGFRAKVLFPVWYFAWGEQSLATYLRLMDEWIAVQLRAGREHSYKLAAEFDLDARLEPRSLGDRVRGVIPRLLIPNLRHASTKAFRAETESALHATAIALRRHQLRHGRLPERLDPLVPEFLAVMPIDRMDGQPLRYRRDSEHRFTLWSVGEDLVDQGGDARWSETSNSKTQWWMARDAVWPRAVDDAEFATWRKARDEKEARRRPNPKSKTAPTLMDLDLMKRYGLVPAAHPTNSAGPAAIGATPPAPTPP